MANIILPQIINAGLYDASAIHKNRIETPERRVSVFEIELPYTECGVSYINNRQYNISPNHIICGKPGQLRHTRLPFKCRFIHLILEDEYLKTLVFSFPDYIDVSDNTKKYKRLFDEIIHVYKFPSDNHELYIGGKILQLLYMLSHKVTLIENANINSKDIVTRGIAFIDEHFTENITLNDIADSLGISPIYFHQMFSRAMGRTTPSNYILNKRINLAKKLLITSTLTLAEIAYQTGFSSQSYFGQVFKRKTNMTPHEYRKINFSRYPEK